MSSQRRSESAMVNSPTIPVIKQETQSPIHQSSLLLANPNYAKVIKQNGKVGTCEKPLKRLIFQHVGVCATKMGGNEGK